MAAVLSREGGVFVRAFSAGITVQSVIDMIAQPIWHTSHRQQLSIREQAIISEEPGHDNTARMSSTEDVLMVIPRELTQNPLRKIWMPCKNGLPEKHIAQKRGNVMFAFCKPAFHDYKWSETMWLMLYQFIGFILGVPNALIFIIPA